jgi:hypothetical protein
MSPALRTAVPVAQVLLYDVLLPLLLADVVLLILICCVAAANVVLLPSLLLTKPLVPVCAVGRDLPAETIQTCRAISMASYNQVLLKNKFKKPLASFLELANFDNDTAAVLERLYPDGVGSVDAYVGYMLGGPKVSVTNMCQ